MDNNLFNDVRKVLAKQLRRPEEGITSESRIMEDLGADSLDNVELIMALEEEFGLEVPDEEAEKLQSVGDVIKYIEANQK